MLVGGQTNGERIGLRFFVSRKNGALVLRSSSHVEAFEVPRTPESQEPENTFTRFRLSLSRLQRMAHWINRQGLIDVCKGAKRREALRQRDGNKCHLCGGRMRFVDGAALIHDRSAATIDHVIPRAHGGTNALANMKLARRRCNERRGSTT